METTPPAPMPITFTGGANFLNLNPGGAQGNLLGNISVTGTLAFNEANAVSLSNVITSLGAIIQSGTATLVLSGANAYSGGTTICGSTRERTRLAAIGVGPAPATGVDTVFNTPGNFSSGISASSAIGTGTLTFNGGTLQAQSE